MGCDIHIHAQRLVDGRWQNVEDKFSEGSAPFDWRSYGMYAFMAGVRNYSGVQPIAEPRGLPEDVGQQDDETGSWPGGCDFGDHSFSWLSVDELMAFDYNSMMEDRRTDFRHKTPGSGPDTCEPGEGVKQTWAVFLGPAFLADLIRLQHSGAERIVFGFDN